MNILLVTMCMKIGGAETHVLELAKGLNKKGHTVYVMSNGGEYVKELENSGIEHIHAPLHNKKIKNILKSYKILKNVIKEKEISVVHAHARIPAMIANWVCKKEKIPFVTTAHGIYKVNPILKILTSWGSKTIAVSEDVKQYVIREYGVKEENTLITVNGIDTEKFKKDINTDTICNEFALSVNKKKIVHVSRLDKETSLVAHLLISLAEEFPDVEMILVGSGDAYIELEEEARNINEKLGSSHIIMTGARTDINQLLGLADFFVGVSRAALEAMAEEKPVILAGNQGYLGILEESNSNQARETNFCCRGYEKPTAENLKKDIQMLLTKSEEEKNQMGIYNRNIVMQEYSVNKMVDDAITTYEKAIEELKA